MDAGYDSINGVPACANGYTLNTMMRERWSQPDALVTTDCGAASADQILNGTPVLHTTAIQTVAE